MLLLLVSSYYCFLFVCFFHNLEDSFGQTETETIQLQSLNVFFLFCQFFMMVFAHKKWTRGPLQVVSWGGIMGGQKVVGQWKGGWAGSKFCLKNDSFFFTFLPCVQVQNFHFPSTLCVIVDVCMQCTILCSGIYHFTL